MLSQPLQARHQPNKHQATMPCCDQGGQQSCQTASHRRKQPTLRSQISSSCLFAYTRETLVLSVGSCSTSRATSKQGVTPLPPATMDRYLALPCTLQVKCSTRQQRGKHMQASQTEQQKEGTHCWMLYSAALNTTGCCDGPGVAHTDNRDAARLPHAMLAIGRRWVCRMPSRAWQYLQSAPCCNFWANQKDVIGLAEGM